MSGNNIISTIKHTEMSSHPHLYLVDYLEGKKSDPFLNKKEEYLQIATTFSVNILVQVKKCT